MSKAEVHELLGATNIGDPDESVVPPGQCLSKKLRIVLIVVGSILLLGIIAAVVLFLVLRNKGGSHKHPYNPYRTVGIHKDPRNYTLILQNELTSVSASNPEARYLAVQIAAVHDHLLSFKVTDANNTRWEVLRAINDAPQAEQKLGESDVSTFISVFQHYSLEELGLKLDDDPFGWQLWGAESQRLDFPIVSTLLKPLKFFDKYIEVELELPCQLVLGLPQISRTVILKDGTYTLWNRYEVDPQGGEEGIGGISFLMCKVRDTKYIGLFMDNSNAHTVTIKQGANTTINYKLTGGVIDLKIFHLGEPSEIVRLYHEYVGKPMCPPLWGLGLQQSRANYATVQDLQDIISKYSESGFPVDALWMDQTLMYKYEAFTVDTKRYPNLQATLKAWRDTGIYFVQTLYPQIKKDDAYSVYIQGLGNQSFVQDPRAALTYTAQKSVGENTGECYFMDIMNKAAIGVITVGYKNLYQDSYFDGLWFRQDSPYTKCSGFCPTAGESMHDPNEFENLPYEPIDLKNRTLPLSSYHKQGAYPANHFNVHNIYPLLQAKTMYDISMGDDLTLKMLFATSVAAPRQGKYASLWRGNVKSQWKTLSKIITETVAYNMAGIPVVGYPVCGYHKGASAQLCLRWYQLAAYLPEMRIHHDGNNPVEPFNLPAEKAVAQAIGDRYSILRFVYTKLTETELRGGAVWEPLGFVFPQDAGCFDEGIANSTFVVGKTLYVVPAIKESQTKTLRAYMPNWNWYRMTDYTLMQTFDPKKTKGDYRDLEASYNFTNVFIKGGSVLPVQDPTGVKNTRGLIKSRATIVIAPDHTGKAHGTMLVARDIESELTNMLYNHYGLNFVGKTLRINLIQGYNNPLEDQIDYFKEVLILNSDAAKTAYVCAMTNELAFHELKFSHDAAKKILRIWLPDGQIKGGLKLKDIETITFGDDVSQSLCKHSMKIQSITYSSDKKSVAAKLESTSKQQYTMGAKLLNDTILYLTVEPSDGKKHWKVPDALDAGVRESARASIDLEKYGLVLPAAGADFSLAVKDSDKASVLTSEGFSFISRDKFTEMTLRINSQRVYGVGERITKFQLESGWYTLFSKGVPSPVETKRRPGSNMYGAYPFYMFKLNEQTDFAGVFILTSNAMDIKVELESGKTTTVMTHVITNDVLEMFVLQKSSPEALVRQFHTLIGRPPLVPYWAFGYHQCRWGYDTQAVLEEVVNNFTAKGIPLDVLWSDIDYMQQYRDFSLDVKRYQNMKEFLAKLKARGISYVPILDAGIARQKGYDAYERGRKQNLFIKSAETGDDLVGIVWPGYAVFTDFTHPDADKYWVDNLNSLHTILAFDGLWLDMNEPTNFCDGECPDEMHYVDFEYPSGEYDMLPYYPGHVQLNKMTISMSGVHNNKETEFNLHDMYGFYMTRAANKYFLESAKTRPFIISRSTFPGSGRYGSHWLGDNYETKAFMEYSITGIYTFQLFGTPLVGADVCGFIGNINLELCKRWMQLGAFYPFYRNHKEINWGVHEPYVDNQLAKISTHAIKTRYQLFRYLYSRYFDVAINGGTFFRPLFWEFPGDSYSYEYNTETFMLGSALKISPSFETEGATKFSSYFPNADWYDLFTGAKVLSYSSGSTHGKSLDLSCAYEPVPVLNVHIRGGSIVPMSAYNNSANLAESMKKAISLVVAPFDDKASGVLYYDDGGINTMAQKLYQTVTVSYTANAIAISAAARSFTYAYSDDVLDSVKILGAEKYKGTKCAQMTLVAGTTKKVTFKFEGSQLYLYPQERVDLIKSLSWSDTACAAEYKTQLRSN